MKKQFFRMAFAVSTFKVVKKVLVLFVLFTLISCSAKDEISLYEQENVISENIEINQNAQRDFAIILSKAVEDNADLRMFLRDEAQKQFDNTYDVFYPYVRNSKVGGKSTFREILLNYTTEKELAGIERSLPLLNIAIPDLSMFDAFSVNDWDAYNDEIAVSYIEGNKNSVFYSNGDSVFSLPKGSLPAFPYMVVKNSERMKVVNRGFTRSSNMDDLQYDFVDDIFNKRLNKPTTRSKTTSYINYNVNEEGPYMKAEYLDQRVKEAYAKYKNDPFACDRDLIYYNMDKSNSEKGKLNTKWREKLWKFRVVHSAYSEIAQKELDDPVIDTECHSRKAPFSNEELIEKIWTNGLFVFKFWIEYGRNNTQDKSTVRKVNVPPYKLFQFSKIKCAYQHSTAFRKSKYYYTVDLSDIKPLWVNVNEMLDGNDLLLMDEPWDLTSLSTNINIRIEESDPTIEFTKSVEFSNTFAGSANFDLGTGGKDASATAKVSLGVSGSFTTKRTHSEKWVEESDELGSVSLNYVAPVIVSDSELSTKGYKIHTLHTGLIEIMIVPVTVR